jgi:hypothetical protein
MAATVVFNDLAMAYNVSPCLIVYILSNLKDALGWCQRFQNCGGLENNFLVTTINLSQQINRGIGMAYLLIKLDVVIQYKSKGKFSTETSGVGMGPANRNLRRLREKGKH